MKKVAVFGCMDTLAGQVVNFFDPAEYSVAFFISVEPLNPVDVAAQHASRPNDKTEFVRDGKFLGKEVVVGEDYVEILLEMGVDGCFVLEGDGRLREKIVANLRKHGIEVCSYVHPSVLLCGENLLGEGVIIFPNCYIGYKADVLEGTIMQSGCTIEHHSVVGRYCDVNPRLTTGGCVKISDYCEINISVDMINRVTIGENARVGAGSLVLTDVGPGELWYGRPAKFVRVNT